MSGDKRIGIRQRELSMRELNILLIVEPGFLFDVCLAQDLSSMYLMDIAEAGTIAMAVPEYSLVEIDGRVIVGRKDSTLQ